MDHLSGEAKGTSLPLTGSALQMSDWAVLRCRIEAGGNMHCDIFCGEGLGATPVPVGREVLSVDCGVLTLEAELSPWPCLPCESS